MTIVTLVSCPQLFRNLKPPRGDPYFDHAKRIKHKIDLSYMCVSDHFLIIVKKKLQNNASVCIRGWTKPINAKIISRR